ncbi:hypothetical protein [Lelliottia nimipressuralis]|uniref:Uncharacterized protein n=1 Tax=Lelliottia nimipressuralis TaxID=69220 RepID=A0ABY3P6I7_9ENTR|nr:hypothetical protein [Lelliottia nimipressuralis]RXJ21504.1 hypothetical protein ETG88_03750 [Lelliottia nimipressuralis]TYT34934.1 hypothetical protein FZO59_04675 [Lelliottia nimipressuralis]
MVNSQENDLGTLRLSSPYSFPVWSIVHYLNRLSMTYFKLVTIQRVCEALSEGCEDGDLIIAEESAKLVSNESFTYNGSKPHKILVNKGDDFYKFWDIIKTHHRPVVFRRGVDGFHPLFDISRDDLLINRLTVTSPPDITVTGISTAITDLYYAAEREERSRHEHQNNQIGQTVRNLSEIITTQSMLQDSNLSPGVKAYAENMLQSLMQRQAELNQEMGITSLQINIRV